MSFHWLTSHFIEILNSFFEVLTGACNWFVDGGRFKLFDQFIINTILLLLYQAICTQRTLKESE